MNSVFPNGLLGFELGVLRHLHFSSIALPFTGEPNLGMELKRWKVRVAANDPMLWSFTKSQALIENHSELLVAEDFFWLTEDAYVPQDQLDNPSLLTWFNESDACWLDNIRRNAARLGAPYKRAIGLTLGMMVGEYVLSFDENSSTLREPLSLSNVLERMASIIPLPYNNELGNQCTNQAPYSFLAECRETDLLFLRLPTPVIYSERPKKIAREWREEWIRGSVGFWSELERARAGKLGAGVQSKQQYLDFVEDILRTAAHIPQWAISHTENGFITGEELVESVAKIRRVSGVYSKDFSDLLGVRGCVVTAGKQ